MCCVLMPRPGAKRRKRDGKKARRRTTAKHIERIIQHDHKLSTPREAGLMILFDLRSLRAADRLPRERAAWWRDAIIEVLGDRLVVLVVRPGGTLSLKAAT